MPLSIENHRNVYILGAGFSASRGLPLIADFMTSLRDAHQWLSDVGRHKEAESVMRVLAYRLDSTPAAYRVRIDLENIEELFSLSDAGRDGLSRDVRLAIAATLAFKTSTSPEPTTQLSVKDVASLPAAWRRLPLEAGNIRVPMYQFGMQALMGAWSSAAHKSAFLTFNYDCLVEQALGELGYAVDFALPPSVRESQDVGAIPVLKLHGSVSWARLKGANSRLTVFGGYEDVAELNGVPELIPPTWRKLFSRELVSVWKRALVEIENATRLVVIGFSMPEADTHFKYLIAAGLRRNPSLREIVFVDPERDTVVRRAEAMFGDLRRRPAVRMVPVRMSQFINMGTTDTQVWSIDRPISGVEQIYHSVY